MRLAIIIINYKTPHFICDCLDSLYGQLDPDRDCVIIVDNASDDGSDHTIEQFVLEHGWTNWIKLERSPLNGGFSAGNNFGIRQIDAEYYLLLNSDTIVRPGAIEQLIEASLLHPEAGLICPRLEWPDTTPQGSCFRRRNPAYEFFIAAQTGIIERLSGHLGSTYPITDYPIHPDWTSFACVMILGKTFNRVGLLDEGYFMYFEDVDFCRRTIEAGFFIVYWPKARVVHLRGGSSPVKQLAAERKRPPRYWYASRNRYYAKFFGRIGLCMANFFWYAGRSISLAREVLKLKQPDTCKRQWFDIWTNAADPLQQPELRD